MKNTARTAMLAAILSALLVPALAVDPAKVPDRYKWDLTAIYPSDAAWKQAKQNLEAKSAELEKYKGTLGSSAKQLKAGLDFIFSLKEDISRLGAYAMQKSDLDVGNADALAMRQAMGPMGSDLSGKMAWVDPEILAIPDEKIAAFLKEEPGLAMYKPVLDDILRMKPHTLSPAGEKLLADASLMNDTPESVYTLFSDAEIPRPSVVLSNGETVRLDASAYTNYRGSSNRWDREHVFSAFFGNLDQFRGTFGAMLNGECKKDWFNAKARGYDSCLASALDGPNIPVAVYENLIKNVRKNLPTLHRYLKLRQRMMGLPELRYSDLYASVVKEVDATYTPEQAIDLTLKAVAPLGADYVNTLKNGLNDRWVDLYTYPGKHSGAYSNCAAYGVHPYMLLNFNGTYEDVSTLAHEAGHSMHSFYSNGTQPFATCDYTTFVAEVASTFNENLLNDYMLKHTNDDAMKLFLLGSYVDGLRQTLFRQTQFAEFELKIHKLTEKGEPLTGDRLNEVYKGILEDYYGAKEGITIIDPVCYSEWAYIPYFYYNFYVFTYATSLTASTALSQMVLEGKPGAVENYRKFLTLGDSMPPIDELKIAGVDMTTDAPFDITMKAMNRAMDQMEALLDKMQKEKK